MLVICLWYSILTVLVWDLFPEVFLCLVEFCIIPLFIFDALRVLLRHIHWLPMAFWNRVVESSSISSSLVLHRIAGLHVSIPSFFIWRAETTAWPLLDWDRMVAPWQLSLRIVSSLRWSLIKLVRTWLFCVIGLITRGSKAASAVVVSIQALVVVVKIMSLWPMIPTLLSL